MINIIPQAEAKSKSKFEAEEKVQQQKISDEKTKQRRPKQMKRNGKSRLDPFYPGDFSTVFLCRGQGNAISPPSLSMRKTQLLRIDRHKISAERAIHCIQQMIPTVIKNQMSKQFSLIRSFIN